MNNLKSLRQTIEKLSEGCGYKQLGYQICGNVTKNKPIHIFYCNNCKNKLNIPQAELLGRQTALREELEFLEDLSKNLFPIKEEEWAKFNIWEKIDNRISQIKEELK